MYALTVILFSLVHIVCTEASTCWCSCAQSVTQSPYPSTPTDSTPLTDQLIPTAQASQLTVATTTTWSNIVSSASSASSSVSVITLLLPLGPYGSSPPSAGTTTALVTTGAPLSCSAAPTTSYSTVSTTVHVNATWVDGGVLHCGNRTDQGNPSAFMTRESMLDAIVQFCQSLTGNQTLHRRDSPMAVSWNYNNGTQNPIYLETAWMPGNRTCPTVNVFAGRNVSLSSCETQLNHPVDLCDLKSNNEYWWKQGGEFYKDCIRWTIRRGVWDGIPPTDPNWRPGHNYTTTSVSD